MKKFVCFGALPDWTIAGRYVIACASPSLRVLSPSLPGTTADSSPKSLSHELHAHALVRVPATGRACFYAGIRDRFVGWAEGRADGRATESFR